MIEFRKICGTCAGIVAAICAALGLVGCSVMRNGVQSAEDDRFAEFTQYVPEPLEIQTDVKPLTKRMPALEVSSANWVAQARLRERELLPEPDRPVWLHAVLKVAPYSAKALDEKSTGSASLLPPVYPELHQYVPKNCAFSAVPSGDADGIVGADLLPVGSDTENLYVKELAVSVDCDIVVMTSEIRNL